MLLLHPSVLIEVVRQIRKGLIEIQKTTVSNLDRNKKETKLFDYIKSQKFERTIKDVEEDLTTLNELQNTEETTHHRLWKIRRERIEAIEEKRRAIDSETNAIISDNKEAIEFAEPLVAVMSTIERKKKRAQITPL